MIVHGQVDLKEEKDEGRSMVEQLKSQFVKEKLKMFLFSHRARFATLTKEQYVIQSEIMAIVTKA